MNSWPRAHENKLATSGWMKILTNGKLLFTGEAGFSFGRPATTRPWKPVAANFSERRPAKF